MSFAAPLWLLTLLPWAAVVALLLWGRLKRVKVPFLQLWKGPEARPRQRQAFEPPSFSLLMAILAMLLALLASARPSLRTSSPQSPPLTIILDRGLTMSARGKSDTRYRETIDLAQQSLRQLHAGAEHSAAPAPSPLPTPVNLLVLPGPDPLHTDLTHWPALAKSQPPTALDTRELLRQTVLRCLADTDHPLIVLSDHNLAIDNPRLVQIPPATPLRNVGIVHLAVRQSLTPQLMVRLRNQSPQTQALLRVFSDNQPLAQLAVDLPPSGDRDYFIDVPRLGHIIQLHLDVQDDLSADNDGYLIQQQAWPRLEPQWPLPAELQRIIDLYTRLRPPSESSKRVAIVTAASLLPSNQPGAVLAAGTETLAQTNLVQVADHPITKAVGDWSKLIEGANLAKFPGDPAWRPIVQSPAQVLVAVRDHPAPAVWVGFHSQQFSSRPEFVIFWTNIFNWLGQGAGLFTSHPIETLGPEWTSINPAASVDEGSSSANRAGPSSARTPAQQLTPGAPPGLWPGLYRRTDGTLLALNAFNVQIPTLPVPNWPQNLARLAPSQPQSRAQTPLTTPFLLAALLALLLAALTWPRPSAPELPTTNC